MINLLPYNVKENVAYSKYNSRLVALVGIVVLVGIGMIGVQYATLVYTTNEKKRIEGDIASTNQEIVNRKKSEEVAKKINERLKALNAITNTRIIFSKVIADLGNTVPERAVVQDISLTGDEKKPVKVTVIGDTYEKMLLVREKIVASERFTGVDIESIKSEKPGIWEGQYSLGIALTDKKPATKAPGDKK